MDVEITSSHTHTSASYELDGSIVVAGFPFHRATVQTLDRRQQQPDARGKIAHVTLTTDAAPDRPARDLVLRFDLTDDTVPLPEALTRPQEFFAEEQELAVTLLARTLGPAR